jgi:23S rRNA pseudouridine1911/1915/1917 synthase
MVLAKSEVAYSRLKQAFRDRKVHKVYHALVQGHPDPSAGTFDAPIGRHPKAEFKFQVHPDGKPSVTHYETIEAFAGASLLEIILETGRTHQIRVHFSAFRHPLVGDTMYGADPVMAKRLGIEHQWLHALRLSFEHPITGETVSFESEYPEELAAVLDRLRG